MMGTPPVFSFTAGRGALTCGALGGRGTGAAGATGSGGGRAMAGMGCGAASARKEAFVSIPSSSTSRVPRRSCQKRCSCTSLYLRAREVRREAGVNGPLSVRACST